MQDKSKTKAQLSDELTKARQWSAQWEAADISQKQAEKALRESEARYRSIAEASIEGIYQVDSSGNYIFVNKAYCNILGYKKEELLGNHYYMVVPKKSIPMAAQITKDTREGISQSGEFELEHKLGHRVPLYFSMVALEIPGEENGYTGIIHDITELKRWEAEFKEYRDHLENMVEERTREIRESEDRFNAFMENIPAAVFMRDKQHRCVYLNSYYNEMLGSDIKRLGKRADEHLTRAAAKAVIADDRDVLAGNQVKKEVTITDTTGNTRIFETHKFPIPWKGRPMVGGFLLDITEHKQTEEALRESEERYRILADKNPHGIQAIDQTGIITYVNPAYQEMLGYTKEELLGKHVTDLLEPASKRPELREYLLLLVKEQPEPTTYYQQNRRKDGEVIEQAVSWNYNRDGEGKVIGFISIITNVTERKRAEEALRESEEKYRTIYDNAQVGLYRSRLSDGKMIIVNRRMAEMFGYDSPEACASDYVASEHYVDPEARGKLLAIMREHGKFNNFEALVTKRDGSPIWIQYSGILFPEMGFFEGVATDITERKQAEEALKESEEKFRNVVERANDAIVVIQDSLIKYINPQVREMLGYLPEDVIGSSMVDHIYPDERKRVLDIYRRRMAGKKVPQLYESALNHKDGSRVEIEISGGLVDYQGKPADLIIARDISERKQLEKETARTMELEHMERMRREIIASVSHELRTPLTAIKGLADTLIQPDVKWDDKTQLDFLQTINREADVLTHLIEDLVEMSQIEAGVMKMNKSANQISDIVHLILHQVNILTDKHKFEIDIPPDLPHIYADEVRISEVITNLISNAVAYSPEGTRIILKATGTDKKITVSVTDQGIGIPAEHQEKVFNRFYRLESGVAHRRGGSGLGLAICKSIVKNHEGWIWVDSEPGQGSTFSFSLPAV